MAKKPNSKKKPAKPKLALAWARVEAQEAWTAGPFRIERRVEMDPSDEWFEMLAEFGGARWEIGRRARLELAMAACQKFAEKAARALREPGSQEEDLQEFWARCQFYEPFTMGGSVWQWVRYKLKGELQIAFGWSVWLARLGPKKWGAFEKQTGGWICDARTAGECLAKAAELIRKTPDFKKQVKAMLDKEPTEGLREVPTKEALRRIEKGRTP